MGVRGIGRGEISLTSIFMKVSLGSLPILRIPRKKAGPWCLNTAGFQMLGRSLRGNQTPMERSCPSLYVSCDFWGKSPLCPSLAFLFASKGIWCRKNKQTKRSADQELHEGGNVHHSAPDNYETWGHFLQHCGSHLSYLKTKEVNLLGLWASFHL